MIRLPNSYALVALGVLALLSVSCRPQVEEVTISVSHRVFTGYHEEFRVKMGEKFQLSDTDYYAKVVEFVPDFTINLSTKKVVSRSDSLNNPAVKVIVYKGKEKIEEVWAFQKTEVPHFSPHSLLGFKLLDFKIADMSGKAEDEPGKTD
jgi:hypothetical protein